MVGATRSKSSETISPCLDIVASSQPASKSASTIVGASSEIPSIIRVNSCSASIFSPLIGACSIRFVNRMQDAHGFLCCSGADTKRVDQSYPFHPFASKYPLVFVVSSLPHALRYATPNVLGNQVTTVIYMWSHILNSSRLQVQILPGVLIEKTLRLVDVLDGPMFRSTRAEGWRRLCAECVRGAEPERTIDVLDVLDGPGRITLGRHLKSTVDVREKTFRCAPMVRVFSATASQPSRTLPPRPMAGQIPVRQISHSRQGSGDANSEISGGAVVAGVRKRGSKRICVQRRNDETWMNLQRRQIMPSFGPIIQVKRKTL